MAAFRGEHYGTSPLNLVRPAWMDRGTCYVEQIDRETFFSGPIGVAIAICDRCPVEAECLEFVLDAVPNARDHGIWGGKSERERRRIRKERAEAAS